MAFDIAGARKEGYTDTEIIAHLTKGRKFDVAGARKEGYSDTEIADYLAGSNQVQPEERPLSTQYQPPTEAQKLRETYSKPAVGEIIKNTPRSAYNLAENIVTAVAHPVETAKTLVNVGMGGVEKLIPGEQRHEGYANAVGNMFVERYGGLENLRQTMTQDPIGFLADASTLLTGAGALPKMGAAAEVGRALEPTGAIARGVSKVATPVLKKGGEYAKEFLGKSTGAGPGAVEQALKGGTEFTDAMRGKVSEQDVLETAQNALQDVKNQRSTAYQAKLTEIGKQTQQLDIAPVKKSLDNYLNSWRINRKPNGTLDFKRSVMAKDTRTQNEVLQMVDLVDTWDDFSPVGVDVLKRNLDDFYTETGKGRAIAAGLKNETKNVLTKSVSGYADMTAEYAKTSKLTKDIEKALSLSKNTGADTSIRKISQILRENFTYRRDLVRQLEDMTGKDIQSAVAGIQLNRLTPRGLQGVLTTSAITGALAMLHPQLLPALVVSSPRLVGEFLNVLGNTSRQIKKVGPKVPVPARQAAFQAGRIQNEVQENQ